MPYDPFAVNVMLLRTAWVQLAVPVIPDVELVVAPPTDVYTACCAVKVIVSRSSWVVVPIVAVVARYTPVCVPSRLFALFIGAPVRLLTWIPAVLRSACESCCDIDCSSVPRVSLQLTLRLVRGEIA